MMLIENLPRKQRRRWIARMPALRSVPRELWRGMISPSSKAVIAPENIYCHYFWSNFQNAQRASVTSAK